MTVTKMFFTPSQEEHQVWQRQSENLFCIELSILCYADTILEITVSQYNNMKSDSFLATFSGFSFCSPQNKLYFQQIISRTP